MANQQKAKAKGRKIGRNKKWCEAYRARGQREKNKVKKILRHLKRFPNHAAAKHRLAELGGAR